MFKYVFWGLLGLGSSGVWFAFLGWLFSFLLANSNSVIGVWMARIVAPGLPLALLGWFIYKRRISGIIYSVFYFIFTVSMMILGIYLWWNL
jgi:hypothetical protein